MEYGIEKGAVSSVGGCRAFGVLWRGGELWGGERLAGGIKKSNISWKMSKTGRAETMV